METGKGKKVKKRLAPLKGDGKREKGEIKEKGEWKLKMKPQASVAALNFDAMASDKVRNMIYGSNMND